MTKDHGIVKRFLLSWNRRMFNRSARVRSALVFEKLALDTGATIAEIGIGGGYFTLEFARRVGKHGKVFAIDTELHFLEALKHEATQRGFYNISTVVTGGGVPALPESSCDMIFLRNVYHHIESDRTEYFRTLKHALKPDGRIVIIDYKPEKLHRIFGHASDPNTIRSEMAAAGYALEHAYDILPTQSFMVFGGH